MFFNWKKAAPLIVSMPSTGANGVTGVEFFKILPGANEVPDAVVKHLTDTKLLEAYEREANEAGVEVPFVMRKSLAAIENEKAAIVAVKECVDVESLKSWMTTEKRAAVLKAIEKQLAEVEEALKPKE